MRRRVSAGERSLQLIVSHSLTHQLTHSRKGSLKNLSPQTRNFGVSPSISAARPVISSFTWLCGSLLGLLICRLPRGAFLRRNSLGFSPRSPAIVPNIAFFHLHQVAATWQLIVMISGGRQRTRYLAAYFWAHVRANCYLYGNMNSVIKYASQRTPWNLKPSCWQGKWKICECVLHPVLEIRMEHRYGFYGPLPQLPQSATILRPPETSIKYMYLWICGKEDCSSGNFPASWAAIFTLSCRQNGSDNSLRSDSGVRIASAICCWLCHWNIVTFDNCQQPSDLHGHKIATISWKIQRIFFTLRVFLSVQKST